MVSETIKDILKGYHKSNLINILNCIQKKEGYISEEALTYVSKVTDLPLANIYSMASFYSFLKFEGKGVHTIRVCNSPSCYLNNSTDVIKSVEKLTGLKPGEHNDNFHFEVGSCIGCCDKAPAMMVDDDLYTELDEKKIKEILDSKK
ncbi:MAG: NAD(P)H-dependent oxidoreductase subunit E [Nanoarchaeota archaeon]|nr:NAD(P)H-dependent oxidoreductase subunit E [Nanoarchaeota archaeon]